MRERKRESMQRKRARERREREREREREMMVVLCNLQANHSDKTPLQEKVHKKKYTMPMVGTNFFFFFFYYVDSVIKENYM